MSDLDTYVGIGHGSVQYRLLKKLLQRPAAISFSRFHVFLIDDLNEPGQISHDAVMRNKKTF